MFNRKSESAMSHRNRMSALRLFPTIMSQVAFNNEWFEEFSRQIHVEDNEVRELIVNTPAEMAYVLSNLHANW